MAEESARPAAIVVVGNEVLSGDVEDHNGIWLSRELARLGVEVGIALTLPDDELLLAEHLRRTAERHAPIFVTGGIGTTLDDVTRQAVARAAGVPLVVRADVVAHLEAALGRPLTPVQRRFAELPEGCGLIPNRIGRAPGFTIGPFVVLPGVPAMLHDMFPLAAERFRRPLRLRRTLFTNRWESEIAALLEELAERAPGVAIGSYPKSDETRHWVEIVLKSRDEARLAAAAAWLAQRLPGQPAA
ncbi:MAG TPA: molybdopterin-binding protein [Candidatus Methanoperedens sp.]|nr:molybdopterin-binding protein [Candidatus Methanoperedens sp.]